MKKLFCLLAVTAIFGARAFAADYADVTIDEVKKAIAEGKITLIDVNGASSYKSGHVPGALNFAAIKDDLASKLPADKGALVVAYCGGPSCGSYARAAKAATALGYTNVKHMSAGISGWLKAGEKIEKSS